MMRVLTELEAVHKSLATEIEKYKDLDPDLFEAKKSEVLVAKDAVNRWTGSTGGLSDA